MPVYSSALPWARGRKIVFVVVGAVFAASSVITAAVDLRLIDAVKLENRDAIRRLLSAGVDVNARQSDGATALHWAVHLDDHDGASRLIVAGADVNAANMYGVTPLWLACENRSTALVNELLRARANPDPALLETGETPLMRCARTGSAVAVEALLAAGADVDRAETSRGQTALMWAAAQSHGDVVQLLIAHGADVNVRSRQRTETISRRLDNDLKFSEVPRQYGTDSVETIRGGMTPAFFAARQGSLELTRLFVAAGASVEETLPDGTTLLMMAIHSGHGELSRWLLERGADPNATGTGYAPLHLAVLAGDLNLVKALLASGANPNVSLAQGTPVTRSGEGLMLPDRLLGATPFWLAAKFIEVDMMRTLVAKGADAQASLPNGTTALMAAAGAGLDDGADRRYRSIFAAARADRNNARGTLETVKQVAEFGADINAIDMAGNSALHIAAALDADFPQVIQFLVDSGANPNLLNKRGQTPLAYATSRGRSGAATLTLLKKLTAPEEPTVLKP